jgi:metal-responsive CopG/Arc/MetJ family transcriptional regulator
MATSFRADDELEDLLQCAIKRTGQTRSHLIREAVSKYCTEIVAASDKSPYERLMEVGFKPIQDNDAPDLASNKDERRRRLRERSTRDNR